MLRREVLEPLGIGMEAFLGPDGTAADVQAACEAYDRALAAAGGVDLQLLGIGTDGHIGFNEPCSSLASRTRIKTLTEQTRVDNARFFGGTSSRFRTTSSPRASDDPGGAASGAAGHRGG